MKVTIRDVAVEAGVAASTVSRVLSGSGRISEETKDKVKAAIKELNYKPNAIARSLANNKTRTLGIILPNEIEDSFTNPFFIQAMQGMSLYAQQQHYYIMYAFAKEKKEELKYVKEFTHNGIVDGVIILKAEANDEVINYLKEQEFPFAVIGHPEDEEILLWVDNDNESATYEITQELIKSGHKQIAFVGAKKEWRVSKDRLAGYQKALRTSLINFDQCLVYHGEEFSEETGEKGAKQVLKDADVTAIIATDDLIAVGVNNYLLKNNLEDKALIGFNNTVVGGYQNPPLSSVDINAVKLGWYASKLLINKLENKLQKTNHYIVETELIKRKSYQ